VQYAASGSVQVAYQVPGEGPVDVVWAPGPAFSIRGHHSLCVYRYPRSPWIGEARPLSGGGAMAKELKIDQDQFDVRGSYSRRWPGG
jgi:hypothetical protein